MKKIVSIIQPFDAKQKICVFKNGNKIDTKEVSQKDIPATLLALLEQYTVEEIMFLGSKDYIRGICKKFRKLEAEKYNQSKKVKITINNKEIKY